MCIFIITSSVILRMRIVSDKIVQSIKKHILCSKTFSENRAVDQIMWKNTEQTDRPQTKTWNMRIACWITKATKTHSEYEILIALPRQQWLCELALMLLVYLPCLSGYSYIFHMLCSPIIIAN